MIDESHEPTDLASEMQGKDESGKSPQDFKRDAEKPVCGLIMPISGIGDCSASHWDDVKDILIDAVSSAGFECRMVSDDDGVGIIQDRIVKNVYNSDIIVCDVSCKNPNVMFELGLRLAFDKPVVVVKDDNTDYSFDTSPVEHIGYPRDLRYAKVVQFKTVLSSKLLSTFKESQKESYSPFLKNFGQFHVSRIENKEVTMKEYIEKMHNDIRGEVDRIGKIVSKVEGKLSLIDGEHVSRAVVGNRGFELCLEKEDDTDITKSRGGIVRRRSISKVG